MNGIKAHPRWQRGNMSIIKATESGKYFGRRSQPVFESGSDGEANAPADARSVSDGSGSEDRVDLSPDTLEVLQEMRKGFEALFRSFPQYRSLISKNTPSLKSQAQQVLQVLSFLSQARQLSADDQYLRLARRDPEFRSFFESVHRLGVIGQEALSQTQQIVRNNPSPTYSRYRA